MKFAIERDVLLRCLNLVIRALPTGASAIPILSNILYERDGGRVDLTATNTQIAITTSMYAYDYPSDAKQSLCIPAKLLHNLLRTLPSETIDISPTPKDRSVTVSCGKSVSKIKCYDVADFPARDQIHLEIPQAHNINFLKDTFSEAVRSVSFAIPRQNYMGSVLTGVNIKASGDDFSFAAADGFRLAIYDGKLDIPFLSAFDVIVPVNALQDVVTMGKEAYTIDMHVDTDKGQAVFLIGDYARLTTQLLHGDYPDYRKLIPTDCETEITLDAEEFHRAVKTASVFADDNDTGVKLNVQADDNVVTISGQAVTTGETTSDVGADVSGSDAQIALNHKHLLDAINALGSGDIELALNKPDSPVRLQRTQNDRGTNIHVMMPRHTPKA